MTDTYFKNFETILRAARNGDLALVECFDLDGKPVPAICAVHRSAVDEDGETRITPLGALFMGNPYDLLTLDPDAPGATPEQWKSAVKG